MENEGVCEHAKELQVFPHGQSPILGIHYFDQLS